MGKLKFTSRRSREWLLPAASAGSNDGSKNSRHERTRAVDTNVRRSLSYALVRWSSVPRRQIEWYSYICNEGQYFSMGIGGGQEDRSGGRTKLEGNRSASRRPQATERSDKSNEPPVIRWTEHANNDRWSAKVREWGSEMQNLIEGEGEGDVQSNFDWMHVFVE